jgi:hypothetical protein
MRIYMLPQDRKVHLFGGFTVNDFADARYPYVRINKDFHAAMIKLTEAALQDNKFFVMYTGFVLDPLTYSSKLKDAHSSGRAVDVIVDGMTAKQSFTYICRLTAYAGLDLVIKEYPMWVHIERRGKRLMHIPYTPTTVSCNSLIPVRT